MSCSVTYNATKGLSLLGDEVGAWMADTTEETLVGSELVTNGTFDTDTDWTKGTGWTIAAGVASSDGSQVAQSNLEQTITIPSAGVYEVYASVTARTAGSILVSYASGTATTSSTGSAVSVVSAPDTVRRRFTFTAGGTFTIRYVAGSTFVGSIDNASTRLAVPDLSTAANGLGLGVYGSITKSAVATGADLVGYSGFSAANYLEQPYNSDLDFGTGDFRVSGWIILQDISASETIFRRMDPGSTGELMTLYANSSGELVFQSNSVLQNSGLAIDDGLPHFLVAYRESGVIYINVDGVAISSGADTTDFTITTATLRFGLKQSSTTPLTNGVLAGWRFAAVAPTAAQIKSIYDKEKILFEEYAMYTQEGESYTLDIAPQGYNPSSNHVRNKSTSLSGVQEVIYLRHDRFWDITTGYTLDTEFDPTRRFIDSVSEGQTFTLAPPDPFTKTESVVLDSDSYQESRVDSSRYFTASFRVKATP